ncbi:MAG TPA: DUF4159 domain-containing protein [Gammaproteobacteria bacterium]
MRRSPVPVTRAAAVVGLLAALAAGLAGAQGFFRRVAPKPIDGPPEAEFHMARLAYDTGGGCAGSRGWCNPWWAIDYPYAEAHILAALSRMTRLQVAEDSRHVTLDGDELFDYPWLFVQQVGQGNWRPTQAEAARLREYLMRGGFLVVDDFHGQYEWYAFEGVMQTVLPGRPIVDIPQDDMLMNILFSLDERTQIPGERHLGWERMQGPPHWRGIYDDDGRLMVAINHNIDMGDAWEHADDPHYPAPMTATAYRFGVNYVIYAMTH